MIKINATQLKNKLDQSSSCLYFLIVGSDPYLQHHSQVQIEAQQRKLGFDEKVTFTIDNQTDWNAIYDRCQSMSLFSSKTLIQLQFGDNNLNVAITNKLNELTPLLSSDISLIISLPKITKTQENANWFKSLSDKLLVVNCMTPEINQLPLWVNDQLKQLALNIEKQGVDLLCYYYEGNLLALSKILEQLSLLYPSQQINYEQLEKHLNDSAIFTPYHWIDAMLAGKIKRSIHILQQLKLNDVEPLILLRTIQRELITLINLKKMMDQQSLKAAYDTLKVWQTRRNLLTPYLNRISLEQLYASLHKLAELEVTVKRDYQTPVWEQLSLLTILFTGLKND